MPGKTWIYAGVPLGIAVPGILHAIAWVLLLSPRSGFINRAWMNFTGERIPLFDIYTMGGLIFAEGLRLVPVAFLMLVPLMRSMDPSLEEAAAVSGASPIRATRRVTLALLLPGVLAISIFQAITAIENFEVPGILGMPVNLHVFSTRVFNLIDNIGTIPAFGQANACGNVLNRVTTTCDGDLIGWIGYDAARIRCRAAGGCGLRSTCSRKSANLAPQIVVQGSFTGRKERQSCHSGRATKHR